jgi:hypothetical protein
LLAWSEVVFGRYSTALVQFARRIGAAGGHRSASLSRPGRPRAMLNAACFLEPPPPPLSSVVVRSVILLYRNVQLLVVASDERRRMAEELRHANEKLALVVARESERAITLRYSFHE